MRPINPPPAPPLPTSPPSESNHHLEAEGIYTSSLFKSEPLYQFYQEREALQEHIYLQSEPKEPGGLLEEIEADPLYQASRLQDSIYEASKLQFSKPQASRPQDLMCQQASPPDSNRNPWGTGPVQGLLNSPDQRTLWAELPQVKESGILERLDPGERRLQEALFEIVSSEASYLKSLNVLVFHFANSQQFSAGSSLLSSKDREVIFSNVLQVMQELRACILFFLQILCK